MPGADGVGVLPVAHEQRAGPGRQPEEARERAQEQDVRIAERQLLAGQEHGVDQLPSERVLPPQRGERRPPRQHPGRRLVRLGRRDERKPAEPLLQAVEILPPQRAVVVQAQSEWLGHKAQQAAEADPRHLHLGPAEQARDGLRFTHGDERR